LGRDGSARPHPRRGWEAVGGDLKGFPALEADDQSTVGAYLPAGHHEKERWTEVYLENEYYRYGLWIRLLDMYKHVMQIEEAPCGVQQ
jgi:hypothetical protein